MGVVLLIVAAAAGVFVALRRRAEAAPASKPAARASSWLAPPPPAIRSTSEGASYAAAPNVQPIQQAAKAATLAPPIPPPSIPPEQRGDVIAAIALAPQSALSAVDKFNLGMVLHQDFGNLAAHTIGTALVQPNSAKPAAAPMPTGASALASATLKTVSSAFAKLRR